MYVTPILSSLYGDTMLREFWKGRSLRFWMTVGMAIALIPLLISAAGGFFLLNRGVMAPMHRIADLERNEVAPIQNVRVLMWDTLIPVDEFIEEADEDKIESYQALRVRVEDEFDQLTERSTPDPEVRYLITSAQENWEKADQYAQGLLSETRAEGNQEATLDMERFHAEILTASDKLGTVHTLVDSRIEQSHETAIGTYRRSFWLAGFALLTSLGGVILGVVLISRVISSSVDRLIDGAHRFADGDREHRINVVVPPELRMVADEFNRMISQIDESEEALADLARRDGLTRLLNRRAYDEALSNLDARMEREESSGGVLISFDIDHFKRVNDTYGHAAGDEVLEKVAEILSNQFRQYDSVFRVGGEEFAILLEDTGFSEACEMAERLRRVIESQEITLDGTSIRVTISLGVAKATPGVDIKSLTEAADAALYRAKSGGRNRVVTVDENGMEELPAQDTPLLKLLHS